MESNQLDEYIFGDKPLDQLLLRKDQTPPVSKTSEHKHKLQGNLSDNAQTSTSFTPNKLNLQNYINNKTNDELQEIIDKIHCPVEDLSITTITNSSHSNRATTPQ